MVSDITPEPDRDDLNIVQCLEEALKDFNCGEVPMRTGNKPTKVLVMFLDNSTGRFEIKVLTGSDTDTLKSSEVVSVMELYKHICLKAMNDYDDN